MLALTHLVGFGVGEKAPNYAKGSEITVTSYGGDMTGGGGHAAVFDGSTSTFALSATKSSVQNGFIYADFSASPKRVAEFNAWGSTDQGFVDSNNPNVGLSLYGKNGSVPTSGSLGTFIGSATSSTDSTSMRTGTITEPGISQLYDYFAVYISISGGVNRNICLSRLRFYEATPVDG